MGQSPDQNYVKTTTYRVPTGSSITNPSSSQASVQVGYYDGLGRPIQSIAVGQSATGTDIVTHIAYDDFGRQTKEFLPYATSGSSLTYRSTAEDDLMAFYGSTYTVNTNFPYSEKQLEHSPLNRVEKQAAPGEDWTLGSGHEMKLKILPKRNRQM